MNLSDRLTAVASLITEGNSIADIGTDHGYIPIYMAQNGLTPKAIAMDVNPGPLKRAEYNIRRYCVENIVSVRLSDGLEKLNPGEADTIVIAGMGGILTVKILSENPAVAESAKELILSPHSDVDLVRKYLADKGFCINREKMVLEDGKFYFVLRAVKGSMTISGECEALFGQILLNEKNQTLYSYLIKENEKRRNIIRKMSDSGIKSLNNINRIRELESELEIIREALKYYES